MFTIRNDDVSFDTDLNEIKRFCEICDKYGFRIVQAITLYGQCRKIDVKMTNDQIKNSNTSRFEDNHDLVDYLKKRNDLIAVHGLWHTHVPTDEEIRTGKAILERLGFNPTYFVPPFNEGDYPPEVEGLTLSKLNLKNGERLEDFLKKGTPTAPILYLHSWRFDSGWYTFDDLDNCLSRLSQKI